MIFHNIKQVWALFRFEPCRPPSSPAKLMVDILTVRNESRNLCVQVIEFDDGCGSVLRIQPLRSHRDEAIYECTATNSVGEINTSAKLTVLEGELGTSMGQRLVLLAS